MSKSPQVIQDKLLDKRKLFLFGDIDTKSALKIISSIHYLNHQGDTPILLYINSNGGDPDDGMGIIDEIVESTSEIWTIVQGKAYSAAADILLFGHQRFATKSSSMMFHSTSISHDDIPRNEYKSYTKHTELIFKRMIKHVAEICDMSEKNTEKWLESGEYLTADQAKKLNIIHDIWSPTKYLT